MTSAAAPGDVSGLPCAGTAKKVRDRKQRALARKVGWLSDLFRAAAVHHTAGGPSSGGHGGVEVATLVGLQASIVTIMARLEDLQGQVTNLALLVTEQDEEQVAEHMVPKEEAASPQVLPVAHVGEVKCKKEEAYPEDSRYPVKHDGQVHEIEQAKEASIEEVRCSIGILDESEDKKDKAEGLQSAPHKCGLRTTEVSNGQPLDELKQSLEVQIGQVTGDEDDLEEEALMEAEERALQAEDEALNEREADFRRKVQAQKEKKMDIQKMYDYG